MTATDIAAWYAAAVATAVFGWDIIKWLKSGPSLRIRAVPNTYYADGRIIGETSPENGASVLTVEEYCHVEIVNAGFLPTTLIDVSALSADKAGRVQVIHSSVAFTTHTGSKPLPALLAPGETWSARIQMSRIEGMVRYGKPTISVRASHRERPINKVIKMSPAIEAHAK